MKKRKLLILISFIILLAFVLLYTLFKPHNQGLYKVTILPSFEGAFTVPLAINDNGQIAGLLEFSNGNCHLFLWDKANEIRDLGPAVSSVSLNNNGQIAACFHDPNRITRAFFWDPNSGRTILPTLGGSFTRAFCINNRGQVVGDSTNSSGVRHAFVWDKINGISDLTPTSTGNTMAISINDAGQVVTMQNTNLLLNLDGNKVTNSVTIPLHAVCRINNNGYIAGMIQDTGKMYKIGTWHAGSNQQNLVKSNKASSLQKGLSYSYYINDLNQIIITEVQEPSDFFGLKVFSLKTSNYIFSPDFGLFSLDGYVSVKGNEVLALTGINNNGSIIGVVQSIKDSDRKGVLFEPVPEKMEKIIKKSKVTKVER